MNKKSFSIHVIVFILTLLLYLTFVISFSHKRCEIKNCFIILHLFVAAFFDIRERKIPLTICFGMLCINMMDAVLFRGNIVVWAISFCVAAVLLVLYLINLKLIGLADILLIVFCLQALLLENILFFLFITFSLSSILGIISGLRLKKFKGISVPLAPCITIAFAIQIL